MNFTVAALSLAGTIAFGALGGHATMTAEAPKSQWDGIYTAEQAKRGETQYAETCAVCHGPNLAGGEMAPGLVGSEFNANWNDLSIRELFDRIRISMPANEPGSLNDQQTADVLSYIFSKADAPAGTMELPAPTVLGTVKYLASKPSAN